MKVILASQPCDRYPAKQLDSTYLQSYTIEYLNTLAEETEDGRMRHLLSRHLSEHEQTARIKHYYDCVRKQQGK
jgi:hypothetical protein